MSDEIDPRWDRDGRPILRPTRPPERRARRPMTEGEAERAIEREEWDRAHGEDPNEREEW